MKQARARQSAGKRRAFWSELGRCLGVMAGVIGFGLTWAEVESRVGGDYPGAAMDHRLRPRSEPSVWLVDGFNVLHAVVLGGRDRADWWKESQRSEVVTLAAGLGDDAEVWVVFDGPEERCGESLGADGVHQVFAPSADEWLLKRVKTSTEPSRIAVVTADRALVSRLERCGARVVSPTAFVGRCQPAPSAGS